ncbi:ATP-binding protein [uncultured Algibacter sp.]|uniref:ATP-binding protein n=1 Tax=uncultured Algibacter sp. TaxID=298659 RepID=UPI003216852A
MKTFLIYFTFFTLSLGYAQEKSQSCEVWRKEIQSVSNYDSIINLSKRFLSRVEKPCKIDIYESLGNTYRDLRKQDSSLYYFREGVKLTQRLKKPSNAIVFYINIASIYLRTSKLDSTTWYLKKAKILLNKENNQSGLIEYYSMQSALMSQKSEKDKAYKYSDSAIDIAIKLKDSSNLPNLYQNIGLKYINNSEYEIGVKKLLTSAQLKEKYKHTDVDGTYYLLGTSYKLLNNFKVSKKYFDKAIIAAKKSGNTYVTLLTQIEYIKQLKDEKQFKNALKYIDSARVLTNQLKADNENAELDLHSGFIFLNQSNKYKLAELCFNRANAYGLRVNKYHMIFKAQMGLFDLNYANKNYKKANQYLDNLKRILSKHNDVDYKLLFHKTSANYYKEIADYKKALENNIEFHRIQDSLFDVDKVTKIAELEKQYDTQNKELKIAELNEAKKAQELLTQKAKTKQNLFLGFLVILGLLFLMGFWFYRKSKKQQNALAKAHKKLSEVDAVKNRLFSIIAHDLRGMLVPFQRAGKVLNHHVEKENYDKVKTLSKDLQTNSQSLSNMLDNLLNWSLEQMNGYTFKKESFSLKKEFETIISNFEQHSKDKNTAIILNYNEDYKVDFDKGAFHVIFRNLIANAIKYTENGTVKISFNKDFNTLNCSVSDTGVGIDKEKQVQLFKLENNNSTKGTQGEKGTGLGLNLVKKFVNMHKGKISVSSKLRLGTRFDISFPIFESKKDLEDNTSISA